jgi:hypothetical protein
VKSLPRETTGSGTEGQMEQRKKKGGKKRKEKKKRSFNPRTV